MSPSSKNSKKPDKAKSASVDVEVDGVDHPLENGIGRSAKKNRKVLRDPEIGGEALVLSERKKEKSKRKMAEEDNEEERSETSSELGCPVNAVAEPKKNKKTKIEIASMDEVGENPKGKLEDNPNSLVKFRISDPLRKKLNSKGIDYLFPIQAMTFDTILDGSDLVGRARTGQGKTLAFVLPILESLTNGPTKDSVSTKNGRPPSVLVLLPTRELANQVHADFETYGAVLGLSTCCVYGGAPYHSQEFKLKKGVDIVVGTPGRVKDHMERGNLNLSSLKFRVLDEADEMLKMGFVDDVELILGKVKDLKKVQTLLFSATLPVWVKEISSRFLKANKKIADLIGNARMKASADVRHIVIPCSSNAKAQLIPDIIRCYSSGGRTIVFTETKESASQLSGLLPSSRALHGDIQQAQREITLKAFRSGKFMTLVATNVAARGLDINDVQLIIQCETPYDVEAYIHRSGRTGRAGNSGVAVMLYDPRRSNVSRIEKQSGVTFEHVTAPRPCDVAEAAGRDAARAISEVSDDVTPLFRASAEGLLLSSGLSAVDLLAKALAWTGGFTEVRTRSLLTSADGLVTLAVSTEKPIYSVQFALGVLRRIVPEGKMEGVTGMAIAADSSCAVFDVPSQDVGCFVKAAAASTTVASGGSNVEVVTDLPRLQEKDQARNGWFSPGLGSGRGARGRGPGRLFGSRGGRGGRGRGRW